MSAPQRVSVARTLAWGIAVFNLVMVLIRLGTSGLAGIGAHPAVAVPAVDVLVRVMQPLHPTVCSILAMLIISRQPRNAIGWLFLASGFIMALQISPRAQLRELTAGSELAHAWLVWLSIVGGVAFLAAWFIPMTFVLQVFPDGRLPSRRWWPLPVATLIGLGGVLASLAFHSWPWQYIGEGATPNPFGIAGRDAFFESIQQLSGVVLLVCTLASFGAVAVRFVRSSGIERVQMKWLVYTAAVTLVPMVLLLLLEPGGSPFATILFISAPSVFAVAITIAILRHRLWDIDVIIHRTLVYSTLTALLALAYFGSVLVLQSVFGALAGEAQSPLVTVLSTLAIAALFLPLRRRVQGFIDRRFYRRKVDAARTLAAFAATARDETDLEKLSARLVQVVDETMQPAHIALWLASPGKGRGTP